MATKMATLRVRSGVQFRPKEPEIFGHYLRKKLCGEELSAKVMPEIDLYSYHSDNLTAQFPCQNRFFEWYFFTSITRKWDGSCRASREAGPGRWKNAQAKSGVNASRAPSRALPTWRSRKRGRYMDEYTIKNSSGSVQDPKKRYIYLTPKEQARMEAEQSWLLLGRRRPGRRQKRGRERLQRWLKRGRRRPQRRQLALASNFQLQESSSL